MQFIVCLSKAKLAYFEERSTQWLWSRIVAGYHNLIKNDKVKHGDMKFDNIILEFGANLSELRVLIADFGLSKEIVLHLNTFQNG